jgi:hypothetical protein
MIYLELQNVEECYLSILVLLMYVNGQIQKDFISCKNTCHKHYSSLPVRLIYFKPGTRISVDFFSHF